MERNILFFPWRDWDKMNTEGFRTREANVLLELIRREDIDKVLCVNRSKIPKILLEFLNFNKKRNPNNNKELIDNYKEQILIKRPFSKIKKINEKLYVLDLDYYLPNPKGNKLEKIEFFQRILEREVDFALKYLNINNYMVWLYDLSRINTAKYFKQDFLLFDAIDNLLEHDDFIKDRNNIKKQYEEVEKSANLIFSVSESIKDGLFGSKKNVFYIPNGVNLELYKNLKSHTPFDMPDGKPIVGYVGLLQERMDIEQLEILVKNISECNFVFIGPVLTPDKFNKIKQYDNVYFLGAKHHSEIPNYIKRFDICIIPHKVNEFTKSMNPLKLYEYLASGKETISTPVPPYRDFENVIHIVDETVYMSKVIKKILSNPFKDFSVRDIEAKISVETWENRLEIMFEKINNYSNN